MRQLVIDASMMAISPGKKMKLQSEHNTSKRIPKDFDFQRVKGLSNEVTEKLEAARPQTLGLQHVSVVSRQRPSPF